MFLSDAGRQFRRYCRNAAMVYTFSSGFEAIVEG